MPGLTDLPLWAVCVVFILGAAVITWTGTKLAHVADQLADRTGMGEILAGALFVGGSTSLAGVVTSVATAAQGYAGLSIGNAVGGLAVQTTFLAIADLAYRRANLEHSAASATGLAQATLLVTMLTIPLLANSAPEWTLWHVHPASVILFAIYGFGLMLLHQIKRYPLWTPVMTRHTQNEAQQAAETGGDWHSTPKLWQAFAIHATITAAAGLTIGQASIAMVEATGLSETAIGTVFTAVANSLPELVTAIAAVRIGAANLAVGDIIGGNAFEVLFLAASDFAYLDGSIYHAFTDANVFSSVVVILMTGVLLLGMIRRQTHGVANIGWESAVVLLLYGLSVWVVFI